MAFLLVANPGAGGGDDLVDRAARDLGGAPVIRLGPGPDLSREVGTAIAAGDVVVACGGDGTIHALAQHLAGTDGVLGVLPGGTHNHFARDLGVDDPDAAMAALRAGVPRAVDVGRVDGRVFVNSVGIGLYPELVHHREQSERRMGRALATLAAAARLWARFEPVRGAIAADGDRRRLDASIAFIGVNRFSTEPGRFGERDRMDEGVLDVRVLPAPASVAGRAALGFDVAVARLWSGRVVRAIARSVDVSLERPRPLALDGEPAEEVGEASVRVEPGALRVLAPSA